jgi:uncharacterized membrane protein
MRRIRLFLQTTLLGGLVVVLPVAILYFVGRWIVKVIASTLQPLTPLLGPDYNQYSLLAHLIVLTFLLLICFLIGLAVRTQFGGLLYGIIERRVLKIAPGYSLVKETIVQLLGKERPPFSTAVLARPFGNETLVSAFITDSHSDGSHTVFVPTGPNPTSGFIFHLPHSAVFPIRMPMERVMRSIISAGAGSRDLLDMFRQQYPTGYHPANPPANPIDPSANPANPPANPIDPSAAPANPPANPIDPSAAPDSSLEKPRIRSANGSVGTPTAGA